MPDRAEVFRYALSLDVQDRAALAQKLLASLEELSDEEAERLWAEEAQRRLTEYRTGRAKATPAEQVAKKARLSRVEDPGLGRRFFAEVRRAEDRMAQYTISQVPQRIDF